MDCKELDPKKKWNILLLGCFAEKLEDKIKGIGDTIFVGKEDAIINKEYINNNDIDVVVSFGYGKILRPEVVNSTVCINVHASYLPYNRGPNPNLWSWIDESPKGVTIHYMDENIDTGDIITQHKIDFDDKHTLRTSFEFLINECVSLFEKMWPNFRSGISTRTPQRSGGTHYSFGSQSVLSDMFTEEWINKPITEFCEEARKRISLNDK